MREPWRPALDVLSLISAAYALQALAIAHAFAAAQVGVRARVESWECRATPRVNPPLFVIVDSSSLSK